MEPVNRKKPVDYDRLVSGNVKLHSAGDLAAAQAAGADVNVLGGTVHDGLDALHIRLPGTVGASVGVADLDTEGHVLVTELTLCHIEAPPCLCLLNRQLIYNSRPKTVLQEKVFTFPQFFRPRPAGRDFYTRMRVFDIAKRR